MIIYHFNSITDSCLYLWANCKIHCTLMASASSGSTMNSTHICSTATFSYRSFIWTVTPKNPLSHQCICLLKFVCLRFRPLYWPTCKISFQSTFAFSPNIRSFLSQTPELFPFFSTQSLHFHSLTHCSLHIHLFPSTPQTIPPSKHFPILSFYSSPQSFAIQTNNSSVTTSCSSHAATLH